MNFPHRPHVLYLHPYPDGHISRGVWARRVVLGLREAGARVTPISSAGKRSIRQQRGRLESIVKGWVKRRLPLPYILILVEFHLIMQGVFRTVRGCWRAWRDSTACEATVVLARVFEYDWSPWLVAKILGLPLILEVHSPYYIERQHRGRRYSRLVRWTEKVQWRRAGRLWAITPVLAKILSDNVPSNRVVHFPKGIRPDEYLSCRPSRDRTRAVVVFVGNFYHWHGIGTLLEALLIARRRSGRLQLLLIGDGISRTHIEERVHSLGLVEDVEFAGALPHQQMIQRLTEADIGVAPYDKLEPFYFEPAKVYEYMGSGLPTVASRQGVIVDILEHRQTGLLYPPGNTEALAEALVELADDPSLRERLGRAARAKVVQDYNSGRTASRIHSLCREVADDFVKERDST